MAEDFYIQLITGTIIVLNSRSQIGVDLHDDKITVLVFVDLCQNTVAGIGSILSAILCKIGSARGIFFNAVHIDGQSLGAATQFIVSILANELVQGGGGNSVPITLHQCAVLGNRVDAFIIQYPLPITGAAIGLFAGGTQFQIPEVVFTELAGRVGIITCVVLADGGYIATNTADSDVQITVFDIHTVFVFHHGSLQSIECQLGGILAGDSLSASEGGQPLGQANLLDESRNACFPGRTGDTFCFCLIAQGTQKHFCKGIASQGFVGCEFVAANTVDDPSGLTIGHGAVCPGSIVHICEVAFSSEVFLSQKLGDDGAAFCTGQSIIGTECILIAFQYLQAAQDGDGLFVCNVLLINIGGAGTDHTHGQYHHHGQKQAKSSFQIFHVILPPSSIWPAHETGNICDAIWLITKENGHKKMTGTPIGVRLSMNALYGNRPGTLRCRACVSFIRFYQRNLLMPHTQLSLQPEH